MRHRSGRPRAPVRRPRCAPARFASPPRRDLPTRSRPSHRIRSREQPSAARSVPRRYETPRPARRRQRVPERAPPRSISAAARAQALLRFLAFTRFCPVGARRKPRARAWATEWSSTAPRSGSLRPALRHKGVQAGAARRSRMQQNCAQRGCYAAELRENSLQEIGRELLDGLRVVLDEVDRGVFERRRILLRVLDQRGHRAGVAGLRGRGRNAGVLDRGFIVAVIAQRSKQRHQQARPADRY